MAYFPSPSSQRQPSARLSAALGQAVLPRLTKFVAEGDTAGMTALYRNATQVTCVIAAPVVATLAFFAEPVLSAWTGKPFVAHQAAPILCLYVIGNGWVSLCAFPYYLQYAKGNLRLHLIGNVIQILLVVPLIFLVAKRFGPVGTGAVWALSNGLYFLIYVPIVHAPIFSRKSLEMGFAGYSSHRRCPSPSAAGCCFPFCPGRPAA